MPHEENLLGRQYTVILTTMQKTYLDAMGIQTWQLKTQPVSSTWENLRSTVVHCMACSLHQTRTQTVFGVGDPTAQLMIIGEAPGFYEDKQGEPFVGRAGQLLNEMLASIGLNRNTVYIANVLKCRPPNNRDPLPEEVQQCTGFLNQQIALVKPALLLALGRIAGHYLLKTTQSMGQLRGKLHYYQDIPLIITYHPAYLLRTPVDKGKAFQDLRLAVHTLEELGLDSVTGLV